MTVTGKIQKYKLREMAPTHPSLTAGQTAG
jgi:hypothetical protein